MEFNRDELEDDHISDLLAIRIAELEKAKQDLKRAKDDATQSWLDSRPLTDELEKMQAELASVKGRVLKVNATISELQAQLGTTDMCIRSAKEEEQKSLMLISNNNQALHEVQEEMEQLRMKIDKKRRRRSKLKLVLRSKRQSLQTLKLMYEAVQMESKAFRMSAAQALGYIEIFEAANVMVQIPLEEYEFLKRKANEQNSLAEWKISVAMEEKLVAEKRRDAAFRRLQKLSRHNISGVRNTVELRTENKNMAETAGDQTNRTSLPKSSGGGNRRNPQQQLRRSDFGNSQKRISRSSIFVRIRTFFVQKLSKYFK